MKILAKGNGYIKYESHEGLVESQVQGNEVDLQNKHVRSNWFRSRFILTSLFC